MASILAKGIRPSFHAVIGWLLIAALACALVPSLTSAYADFRQAQASRAQYQKDCSGVSGPSGARSGPCYISSAAVTYNMEGLSTGENTLVADIPGLGLDSTREVVPGHFNPSRLPTSGTYSVQVWRNRATKILMGSRWRETSDNPFAHTGAAQVVLLALGSIVAWASALLAALLLVKGFLVARKEADPIAGSGEATSRIST